MRRGTAKLTNMSSSRYEIVKNLWKDPSVK